MVDTFPTTSTPEVVKRRRVSGGTVIGEAFDSETVAEERPTPVLSDPFRRVRSLSTSDIVVNDEDSPQPIAEENGPSAASSIESLVMPNASSLASLVSSTDTLPTNTYPIDTPILFPNTLSILTNQGSRRSPSPTVTPRAATFLIDQIVPSQPSITSTSPQQHTPSSKQNSPSRRNSRRTSNTPVPINTGANVRTSSSNKDLNAHFNAASSATFLAPQARSNSTNRRGAARSRSIQRSTTMPTYAGVEAAYPSHTQSPAKELASMTPVNVIRKYRLRDYILGQLTSSEYGTGGDDAVDSRMEAKKERIENFLTVPWEFEKLMFLGYLICLDAFLYVFTILPARIIIALLSLFKSVFWSSTRLSTAQKCDLMKGLLVIFCCYMLENVDGSRVYHSVRGQSTIKLYVIFNMLEIFDKLLCAFGHDILDSLFSKTAKTESRFSLHRLNRVTHFSLALAYVFGHSMILFYQVMALNVAINSFNNTLFSLLLSNQFIEIKGSVFKRFERENLFQLACADIVERFQLSVFLLIICTRNFVELTGTTATSWKDTVLDGGAATNATVSWACTLATSSITSLSKSIATETPAEFFHRFSSETAPAAATYLLNSSLNFLTIDLPALFATHRAFVDLITFSILLPACSVLATEFLVDWLKHAFVTKFNQLKVGVVYKKYRETLIRDLAAVPEGEAAAAVAYPGAIGYVDRSPAVARRVGFVSLPLACLVVRLAAQTVRMVCLDDGCKGMDPWAQDWSPPKSMVVGFSGIRGCVEGVLWGIGDDAVEIEGFPGCVGDVMWDVWRDKEVWIWVGERSQVLGLWFLALSVVYLGLLGMKLVVGFNLMKLAQDKIRKLAASAPNIDAAAVSTVTPVHAPSTPTRRKGSTTMDFSAKEDTDVDVITLGKDEKLDKVDRFSMVKSRIV